MAKVVAHWKEQYDKPSKKSGIPEKEHWLKSNRKKFMLQKLCVNISLILKTNQTKILNIWLPINLPGDALTAMKMVNLLLNLRKNASDRKEEAENFNHLNSVTISIHGSFMFALVSRQDCQSLCLFQKPKNCTIIR